MLTIRCKNIQPHTSKTDCLVLPVFSSSKQSSYAEQILKPVVTALRKRGDISGKPGESVLLPHCEGISAERVLLVGAGEGKSLTRADYLTVLNTITDNLGKHKISDATLMLDELNVSERDGAWIAQLAARKLVQSVYRFDQMKSDKKPASLKSITWHTSDTRLIKLLESALHTGSAVGKGMAFARDLGNLPGNICTPEYLAKQSLDLAKKHKALTVKVLEEKQMRALKMGSLLSVSAGSSEPAKLVILDYQGVHTTARKTTKPIVLVGKGITFDSGGISLKPGAGMEEMKFDMCGAASVLGVMQTIIEMQMPIHVVGILACAENMPGNTATKPGDIVTSMSGKTIEVINTDAEGRLVLCDALTYAERYEPAAVIDIATLTGACVIALGNHASGLFSNRDSLSEQLYAAGQLAEDKAWRMPLWEEYQQQLKSPYADIANVGGRNAGSVTAACFLARFAEKYAWAHLDIAGTAWNSNANKGATGRPVPLLVQFLQDYCHA